MALLPEPLQNLVEQFSKLPGVGAKTAERLAFFALETPEEALAGPLARALEEVKRGVIKCPRCGNYTVPPLCPLCADEGRDKTTLCVVETPRDVLAVEKSGLFRGLYHVLGGKLSPLRGVGPEQLGVENLIGRVKTEGTKEVILATGADVEGETTALFLGQELRPLGVKISRIAYGIPVGSSLDYTDEVTLSRAIEGRVDFGG